LAQAAKLGGPSPLRKPGRKSREEMMAQVKTVEYGEVFGVYILGFKKMDAHMAEMMNEGWTVQSTQT
jgi:hypothetical protein